MEVLSSTLRVILKVTILNCLEAFLGLKRSGGNLVRRSVVGFHWVFERTWCNLLATLEQQSRVLSKGFHDTSVVGGEHHILSVFSSA
jgi:hypothetical protein